PTVVVIFDAVKDTMTVVTPVRAMKAASADVALARAVERLTAVLEDLDRPLHQEPAIAVDGPMSVIAASNTAPDEFRRTVLRGKDWFNRRDRSILHRALQPGDAYRVQRRRRARSRARCARCACCRLSGRHRFGCPEGAGHGDHR